MLFGLATLAVVQGGCELDLEVTAVARRKKLDEVAVYLELAIFSGCLPVGDKIPSERVLMEQFEVDRPTVREAECASQCLRPGV